MPSAPARPRPRASRRRGSSIRQDGFGVKSLDRYAEPDEIADAVAFLLTSQSNFMNGQVLRVDGGETLYPG